MPDPAVPVEESAAPPGAVDPTTPAASAASLPPTLDQLQALAKAYGVGIDFWGFYGDLHPVSAMTLTQILAALGVDASTEAACERALADRTAQPWRQLLPPTVVMREGAATRIPVHVHHGDDVRVWVVDESGTEWPVVQGEDDTPPREIDGVTMGQATFWLPQALSLCPTGSRLPTRCPLGPARIGPGA